MKKIIAVFIIFLCGNVFAANEPSTDIDIFNLEEITDTQCATEALANALKANASAISAYDSEQTVRAWVYDVLMSAETISDVLACPELSEADEHTTIKFMPIKYEFPDGDREIVINYETQVKILEQRLKLATKTELPTNDPNPDIDQNDPNATWVNTDPAWYAVMVTRPGALNEFVGKDKNNTVSFKWIEDNIDNLYPKDSDGVCSTRSGIGAKVNHAMVHRVIHEKTAKIEGSEQRDKNNYYIAGDIDLRWVSYAEVAFDIALTVVTWGIGAAATGALKGARAAKTMGQLAKNMKRLTKIDKVQDYVRASVKVAKAERNLENIAKVEKSVANISKLEKRLAKAAKGTKKYDRIADQLRAARKLHADDLAKMGKDAEKLTDIKDLDKLADMSKASKQEIEETRKLMEGMAKNDKNVAEYTKNFESLKDISKYAKELKAFKKARTGNVLSRAWQGIKNGRRSLKAVYGGTKKLDKAAKVARHGMKSGRVRDWLFHSTRRNLARITRTTSDIAALSFVIGLIGDFYDRTEVSTDEFSNGIKMKPFLLLSGDSIEGQDNVVNYGMWLMWSGDSTSAEDDDAAYLQAMDFAQKFYQDLNETQAEEGKYSCDVDIYVVRPIIRNPGAESQELYWLVMNDEPWTTESVSK